MNTQTNNPIKLKTKDGSVVDVYRCLTAADVDSQNNIPSNILALLTFAPSNPNGGVCVSTYTRDVLTRFHVSLGDTAFRSVFRELIVDIQCGFNPHNPFGVLISRLRRFGCSTELVI